MSEAKTKICWLGEDIETLSREKLINIIITLNAALVQMRIYACPVPEHPEAFTSCPHFTYPAVTIK